MDNNPISFVDPFGLKASGGDRVDEGDYGHITQGVEINPDESRSNGKSEDSPQSQDGMRDDWVRKSDGSVIFDSRVNDQESVEALYGENAVYRQVGYSYTTTTGENVVLGDHGFFKSDGVVKLSDDLAVPAYQKMQTEIQKAESNLYYTSALGVLTTIGSDLISPEPTDIFPIKWGGYAIAAIAASALIYKMSAEIDGIRERYKYEPGLPGAQYSLRATTSGACPCFNCVGGTMNLSAGDVWKYGETTNPSSRYSQSQLNSLGLEQTIEFTGTQLEIKIMEKTKIYGYFIKNGHLPPGNKIFR
jgi:hypothetical protein